MNPFLIDFRKLVVMLLPTFLRQPTLMAWSITMTNPIKTLHERWLPKREDRLYNLQHVGQVCHLKAVLNDYFYIADYAHGFQIVDEDAQGDWVVLYDETGRLSDEQVIIHDDEYIELHDERDILPATDSFVVQVPASVPYDKNVSTIKRIVAQHRLASRTFTVKIKQ